MTGFRHLGDRPVHQGYIWSVAVGSFEDPDGTRFERDIVRSPGAVAAIPLRFRPDGTAYTTLVRQYRAPMDQFVVEVPAGMRDVPDEPLELTAARELVEEVGLEADSLEHLLAMYPSVGMTDSVLHIFLATDVRQVPRETHGPEEAHSDVFDVTIDDAIAMVMKGEIHDAKTVIALLLVDRRLRG